MEYSEVQLKRHEMLDADIVMTQHDCNKNNDSSREYDETSHFIVPFSDKFSSPVALIVEASGGRVKLEKLF
jgi:hypothetical protein